MRFEYLGLFIFACICFVTSISLISIKNIDVIDESKVGELLEFSLSLVDELEQSVVSNTSLSSCILVNGYSCSCFSGSLLAARLEWTSKCTEVALSRQSRHSQASYISIQIRDNLQHPLLTTNGLLVSKGSNEQASQPQLTLVLTLTIDDLSRAIILLLSLSIFNISTSNILEMLVLVPVSQQVIIYNAFSGFNSSLPFPIHVLPETAFLLNAKEHLPYAIQMSLKLLVSSIVRTDFYITLDADLICLHPNLFSQLIQPDGRAIYHHESIEVHQEWWFGSWNILGLTKEHMIASYPDIGFHVTPSVLSTYGAMLTVNMIEENMGSIDQWLHSLSNERMWSEYTLYCSALTYLGLMNQLHAESSTTSVIDENGDSKPLLLHCNNVWYHEQLPWDAVSAKANENCLFSVVQSTTNVKASTLLHSLLQL